MRDKLTLKLDKAIIARAKRFAEAHNTSLSKMVERYLDELTKHEKGLSPLTKSLHGVASLPENPDVKQDYYEHLLKKHSPEHAD